MSWIFGANLHTWGRAPRLVCLTVTRRIVMFSEAMAFSRLGAANALGRRTPAPEAIPTTLHGHCVVARLQVGVLCIAGPWR